MDRTFANQLGDVRCPHDYPWYHNGACWPSHYFDTLDTYGPSVPPLEEETESGELTTDG